MKKHLKMDEVAKLAGVSKTTISRFLNGKYEYMSAATREHIQKVIDEIGYRPNRVARNLRSQHSHMLGCIIADITNPVSSILVKGINDVCTKRNYAVYFFNTNNEIDLEMQYAHTLIDLQVDGLLINTSDYENTYLHRLAAPNFPIVLAERSLSNNGNMDCVISESIHSTFNCIQHLYEQGFTDVGFFCSGNIHLVSSRIIRYRCYKEAMREYFSPASALDVYVVSDNIEQSKAAIIRYFNCAVGQKKAIFCANGVALLNTLNALFDMQVEIGKYLGICSFDDWGWPAMVGPGITTIKQDSYLVGTRAAQILIDRIEGVEKSAPLFLEVPSKLIIRGSTCF